MTRSGVGRTARAISRSEHARSTGEALAPPANRPGRERSRFRRRRSALRIAVRALVVGGFAGVAWLLTAGAARAADVDTPVTIAVGDLPVVTLVNGSGSGAVGRAGDGPCAPVTPGTDVPGRRTGPATPSSVGELLAPVRRATAVALPCATVDRGTPTADPSRAGSTHASTDPTADAAGTAGADAVPVRAAYRAGRAGTGDPLGAVVGLVTPLGTTDAPTAPTGLFASVDVVLDPATDVLHGLTAPFAGTLRPVVRSIAGGTGRPDGAQPQTPVLSPTPDDPDGHTGGVEPGQGVGASDSGASGRRSVATELRAAGASAARLGRHLPDRTHPAPLGAYLGTGPGAPANGGGSPVDGGLATVVISSVAGSMLAFRQPPAATDIGVPRHDAEAPTVSPD
ncbi:hypothetical protein SAMN05444365_1011036 [Micromonospora pattaloongensis]|uniref:Uncharacterized protein n=1 Tax=Micromonospora pattaloongensis TaxID=405436 RepID=A0A1H3HXX2_9ACTN|nr:hypothetical protein [Micromonospora pattaloongensis]SDY20326.1 hypothetical protein SAMN05444365_1011036 [Micromonospora pattaloongensis]